MRNNFRKYGRMVVRFETPEERSGMIRVLEEQRGFRIGEKVKQLTDLSPLDTKTFVIDLKFRKYAYGIRPLIGAAMMSGGVRAYSAQEFFRIAGLGFKVIPRFPVFHIPHTGDELPPELYASVCISEEEFRYYQERMSDTEVWRFVPGAYYGGDMTERFRISRLLCDVERFTGPEEEMEQYGMGFCYEKAFDGKRIKHVTEELKELTRKYYDEHHTRMDRLCERHPRILLFDLHSFSEETLPDHIRGSTDRVPDVCIGTDPQYTPDGLIRRVEKCLEEAGLEYRINKPYSGTFVPGAVLSGKSSCDLVSVMLEVNKSIYLDQNGSVDEAKALRIREVMNRIVTECVDLG